MIVNMLPSISVISQNMKHDILLAADQLITDIMDGWHKFDGTVCTKCGIAPAIDDNGMYEECIMKSIEDIHNS